jgi:hypothetical protein
MIYRFLLKFIIVIYNILVIIITNLFIVALKYQLYILICVDYAYLNIIVISTIFFFIYQNDLQYFNFHHKTNPSPPNHFTDSRKALKK